MSNYTPIGPSPVNNNGVNQNQYNLPPSTIVVHQSPVEFGPRPQIAYCLNCEKKQVTTIEYMTSNKTNVAALLLCMVGCWLCCCFPYCMKSMKNAMHYCSVCGQFMGVYNK